MKKRTYRKLNRIERALLYIADMMQDPVHDQYPIRHQVLDILGLEIITAKEAKLGK